MTPERMQRMYELFEQALERPPEERAGFLSEACGDDAELRAEVDSLLEHDSQVPDEFMGPPEPDPPFTRLAAARTASPFLAADAIAGYEILAEIHRGGQGVVYKAVQKATKRTVALKLLLQGPYASPRQRHRFEREIDLVAGLQHPHIVTIYDSGVTRGDRHYFAMEYIHGQSLNAYLSDKDLSIDETLRLFQKICAAVNYAHQRGVIHRDLKPGNIRIDANGEPHILDFGLAKAAGADLTDGVPVTVTGEFMGTLAYASPEQTKGDPNLIDVRTDVYSLGVILYEMLTGKYPYPVVGQMAEVLRNIAEAEPKKPSTIRRQINDEVQTIILKALAKERERRYQSAENLARDVQHYLSGEPIDAKRDSTWYVIRKSLRRYRVPVAVAAAFVIVVTVGFLASLGLWQQAERERDLATEAETRALAARDAEAEAKGQALHAQKEAEQAAQRARLQTYIANVRAADLALVHDDLKTAKERLLAAPKALRGWDWGHYFLRADQADAIPVQDEGTIRSVAFSPDGGEVALVVVPGFDHIGADSILTVRDLFSSNDALSFRQHERGSVAVAISEDGKRVLSGGIAAGGEANARLSGEVRLWDSESGTEILSLYVEKGPIVGLAISPDGNRMVTGSLAGLTRQGNVIVPISTSLSLKLWDATTGQELRTLCVSDILGAPCVAWAFSPDGKLFAAAVETAGVQDMISVWDAYNGDEILILDALEENVVALAFSPDSAHLASCSVGKSIKIWSTATGEVSVTMKGHEGMVAPLAFSPDGSHLASGAQDHSIRIWNTATGEASVTLRGHESPVRALTFSPDGSCVASGASDNTIRIWRNPRNVVETVELRKEKDKGWLDWLRSTVGAQRAVQPLIFSPDCRYLASVVFPQRLILFDAVTGAQLAMFNAGKGRAFSFCEFSRDSSLCAALTVSCDPWWEQFPALFMAPSSNAPSSLSQRASTAEAENNLILWRQSPGAHPGVDTRLAGPFMSMALYPDSSSVVVGTVHGELYPLNLSNLQRRFTVNAHEDAVIELAVSPDGSWVASRSSSNVIKLWSAKSGEPITTLPVLGDRSGRDASPDICRDRISPFDGLVSLSSLTFSADTKYLACVEDDAVIVWNTSAWTLHMTIDGQGQAARSIQFSPDGRYLAIVYGCGWELLQGDDWRSSSSSMISQNEVRHADHEVRIVNLATNEEVATLRGEYFRGGRNFSDDGRRFVLGSLDDVITVWDTATGEEITELRDHQWGLLTFSSDETLLNASMFGEKVEVLRARLPGTQTVGAEEEQPVLRENGNDR